MSTLGSVQVGKKAPNFRCEAVHKGIIEGTWPAFCSITLLIVPQKSRSAPTSTRTRRHGLFCFSYLQPSLLCAQPKCSRSKTVSKSSGTATVKSSSSPSIPSTRCGTGKTSLDDTVAWARLKFRCLVMPAIR
jgi:hypothetical protein